MVARTSEAQWSLRVTVQLHDEKTGLCWGPTFTGSQILKKDGVKGLFKAEVP